MTVSATWRPHPLSGNYDDGVNWKGGIVAYATASFGTSTIRHLTFSTDDDISGWVFKNTASNYVFAIPSGIDLHFAGAGIVIHGGHVKIFNDSAGFAFENLSTAGSATIINNSIDSAVNFSNASNAGHAHILNSKSVTFNDASIASHAVITNNFVLFFRDNSSAAHAVITTTASGVTEFFDNADGGAARFINKLGGTVSFSPTTGPGGFQFFHAGSIEGAGTYHLGSNDVTVGSNNRSTNVSGLIDGSGGTLEKDGLGTLKLSHANNTFSDGVILIAGTLDIAAVGAAGTGNIDFATGSETHRGTLKIENAAFTNHALTTEIQQFNTDDKLLLPGLKFRPHAKATYDSGLGVLTVKSGHVTDTFTQFFNAASGHYKAVDDGHGGTKVVVVALGEKSTADDGESFQFKSDVARSNEHRAVAELAVNTTAHTGADTNGGDEASLDAALHPHMASSDFWHQGDFGLI
jgi:autotransporter-associated beta strand protein